MKSRTAVTCHGMGSSRGAASALFLAGVVAWVVACALWFDNPTVSVNASDIDDSGSSGDVECSIAPWDAGLNGNDNGPGGEHLPAFHDEVATECYAANIERFRASAVSGALGLLLLVGAAAAGVRSMKRRKAPPPGDDGAG